TESFCLLPLKTRCAPSVIRRRGRRSCGMAWPKISPGTFLPKSTCECLSGRGNCGPCRRLRFSFFSAFEYECRCQDDFPCGYGRILCLGGGVVRSVVEGQSCCCGWAAWGARRGCGGLLRSA